MKILIINGPNINMLGIRETDIYGRESYAELLAKISKYAQEMNIETDFYQSNHEGALIDAIQNAYGKYDGIIINPAAYTHTSIAIADALRAVGIPSVEVHISDIFKREDFRRKSYIREFCIDSIIGKGTDGYLEAIDCLCSRSYE